MSNFSKNLMEKCGGWFLDRLASKLSKMPPERVERFGERLGGLFFRFGIKRRERALSNLSLAFPRMGPESREGIARGAFSHFGRVSADFISSRGRTLDELEQSTKVVGREHLEEALALQRGVLLITGHLGNWERASAWIAFQGIPISVVIRNADQDGVNRVVNELRTAPGTRVIPRGNSARTILERLRKNEIVGIIPDQNAEDAFLPFFDHPAGTNLGVGVIQERTKSAVLPVTCFAQGNGQYVVKFYPLIEPFEGYETKGEGLLRAINVWLEMVIKEHPEQWLWFHDRWRNAREAGLM